MLASKNSLTDDGVQASCFPAIEVVSKVKRDERGVEVQKTSSADQGIAKSIVGNQIGYDQPNVLLQVGANRRRVQ